ncbi:MAG: undecaprenyl-diphosphatase [Candidatus Omnitrophica bacterium CG07_land_8_20_14_0_80_42_15]|uniref:Undecaprenyl-diphosphatase n=1 Tax=Candidatus Aquitaenariimonas noxiae TaxID=1974741 RepID=A0A2J0KWI6_9BACT|nr:MAG: undecaprenyl-diphosphatase [Candidatus Omnitrophica bacterium CG07_land_8_20_14_0_80_42_15]
MNLIQQSVLRADLDIPGFNVAKILESIVFGIIQGIAEFLPISSSGHIVIAQKLFGYAEPSVVENVLLHVGTLVAIVIFFFKDILDLFKVRRKEIFLIAIGTIPIVALVFFFGDSIEGLFKSTRVIGGALIITAIWLLSGSLVSRYASNNSENSKLSGWQALLVGISQAIAIVPGVSRSGATISTALLLKKNQDLAFRFSFLLSIPAVFGALLYKAKDIVAVNVADLAAMLLGSFIACVIGVFALWFLKRVLIKNKFYYFSVYCAILGLVLLFI